MFDMSAFIAKFITLPASKCAMKVANKECGAAGPFKVDVCKCGTAVLI